jgi:hypothetical protein
MRKKPTTRVAFHRLPQLRRLRELLNEIGRAERANAPERVQALRREYRRLSSQLRRTASATYPHLTDDSADHLVVYHVLHGRDLA